MEERMDLRDIAAVLFDMDGTLVDSDAAVERAWTTWAGEHGVDATEVITVAHGSPSEPTVRRMLPHLDEPATLASAARQLALQYDDLSDVIAAPGAHELLAVLAEQQVPWAVVTSADARLAKARLDAAGIAVAVLVTIDDLTAGKPDPAGYLLGAKLLGVEPGRCLVVEDAAVGVTAGRAAGAWTAALRGVEGDLPIASLHELAEAFRAR
jgi:sugar-phosphatase